MEEGKGAMFRDIALIVLGVSLVIGIIVKIVLKKQRERLEGFHGYIHEMDPVQESATDDWEWL